MIRTGPFKLRNAELKAFGSILHFAFETSPKFHRSAPGTCGVGWNCLSPNPCENLGMRLDLRNLFKGFESFKGFDG